jgi:predicted nucleic acid-binding protein
MLVDTAIFIDYLKGKDLAAEAILHARSHGEISMHAVVAAELLTGVLNRSELRRVSALISTCRLIMPDASDIRHVIKLLEKNVLANGVDWNDCLIAATALRLKQPVITPNEKHFRIFRGLTIMKPYV